MPNWCTGDLRIRGTKENIINFLENGLLICEEPIPFVKEKHCIYYIGEKSSDIWIKNSRRQFLNPNIRCNFTDAHLQYMVADFIGAWGIDEEALRKLSEEFHVDFRIIGFERGMEFNIDLEIINGVITKDEEEKFDNYKWECIFPTKGG